MISYMLKRDKHGRYLLAKRIDGTVQSAKPVYGKLLEDLLKQGIIEPEYIILHYAESNSSKLDSLLQSL